MPPGLLVEFPIADIGQRIEIPELMECIHDDIVKKIDESDVIGVQVIPARWPRKVQVLCAHQAAKDCLMIQGLDILGRHIELNEPGRGVIKVIITGAPLDMQNDVIKTLLESYATITEFRIEHMTIKGRRSNWRSGTRHAFVFNIKETIPPAAKLPYNEGEVNISGTMVRCISNASFAMRLYQKDMNVIRLPQEDATIVVVRITYGLTARKEKTATNVAGPIILPATVHKMTFSILKGMFPTTMLRRKWNTIQLQVK